MGVGFSVLGFRVSGLGLFQLLCSQYFDMEGAMLARPGFVLKQLGEKPDILPWITDSLLIERAGSDLH